VLVRVESAGAVFEGQWLGYVRSHLSIGWYGACVGTQEPAWNTFS